MFSLQHRCVTPLYAKTIGSTTQFVTLLATPTAFVSVSYLCSLPHFIYYKPSFRYHYTTFVPIPSFISWLPTCHYTNSNHTAGSTFHFAKPTLQYSLGFINASLRTASISVGFSPPAANNFCVPCLPAPATCLSWFLNHNTKV